MIIAITKHYCYRHNYGYCYYGYCDYDYHSIVERKDVEIRCTGRKAVLGLCFKIHFYILKIELVLFR